MAERALRGTRLGATSYENDRNTDLAPRQEIAFDCPKGHHFTVPFAAEAEVPATWECRVCGVTAFTATGDLSAPRKAKPPRSHWDMLRERRSIADLEEVLAERLALIRSQRGEETPRKQQHEAPQERLSAAVTARASPGPFLLPRAGVLARSAPQRPAGAAPRSAAQRDATPQRPIRQNASTMMDLLILLEPWIRSTNVIGTSTTRRPAFSARRARST